MKNLILALVLFVTVPCFAQNITPVAAPAATTTAPVAIDTPPTADESAVINALTGLAHSHPYGVTGVIMAVIIGMTAFSFTKPQNDQIASLTRSVYKVGGMLVVSTGLASASLVTAGIGSVITIVGLVMSHFFHSESK